MTNKVISGAFDSSLKARSAINELYARGVRQQAISVMMPEQAKDEFARIDDNTKAPEGAAIGGAAGIALGGLAAGLTAVATVIVPGVGILAAGPIVAALAGAGAGGVVGGALGGLIGYGVTEHEAKLGQEVLKKGGYVVMVSTDNKSEHEIAKDVFDRLAVKSETTKGQAANSAH
ncbi:MAG: hypothetical protein KC492_11020, partial [Myxococcales bacterium]|nr:hypothetical protein [Myxococcales bacterium]